MYESFYGLTEKPFNLTPDPRFLFLSEKHKEAFAHLLYGIKNRTGFIMVSGEIGTGKTTICRSLLNQLDPDVELAFIFNPCLSPDELLRKINEDFGIESRADSLKALIDELNEYLLDRNAKGKNCVLVIDEAQNLSPGVLEQIRLLSNLETETQKLLQIVLIGQPELAMCLQLPELRQLNQRITARYHLKPLNMEETIQYIAYRLRVAGGRRKVHFTRGAVKAVYKASGGTPRVINAIADRALLIGYTKEARDITKKIVMRAIKEIRGAEIRPKKDWKTSVARFLPNPALVSSALVIVALAVLLVKYLAPIQYFERPLSVADREAVESAQSGIAEAKSVSEPTPSLPSMSLFPENFGEDVPTPIAPTTGPETAPAQPQLVKVEPLPPPVPNAKTQEQKSTFAAKVSEAEPAAVRNASLAAVIRAWNMAVMGDYPAGDGADALASFSQAYGLTAESLKPSLDQLLALNMPALAMVDVDGKKSWVALVGDDEKNLRVSVNGETIDVPRDEFEKSYAQQAVVFWRDENPKTRPMAKDSSGPEVHFLQRALRALDRLNIDPTGTYNDATANAIEKLQSETGLTIDGVAGKQVRMVLASWISRDVPSLRHKEEVKVPDAPPVEVAAPAPKPKKAKRTEAVAGKTEEPKKSSQPEKPVEKPKAEELAKETPPPAPAPAASEAPEAPAEKPEAPKVEEKTAPAPTPAPTPAAPPVETPKAEEPAPLPPPPPAESPKAEQPAPVTPAPEAPKADDPSAPAPTPEKPSSDDSSAEEPKENSGPVTELLNEEPDAMPTVTTSAPEVTDSGVAPMEKSAVSTQELPPAPRQDELPPLPSRASERNVTPPASGNIFLVPSKPKQADL